MGVGTGKNIEFYPDDLEITAIDFSERMLEKARHKAEIYKKKVKLMVMDSQSISFPDNSFDTIFKTCVFCSVPDPLKGLREMRRVCRSGGRVIMIEHVRSEKKVLGLIMDVLNPLVVNLYGANINRRTVDNLRASGFGNIEVRDLSGGIVKKLLYLMIKSIDIKKVVLYNSYKTSRNNGKCVERKSRLTETNREKAQR